MIYATTTRSSEDGCTVLCFNLDSTRNDSWYIGVGLNQAYLNNNVLYVSPNTACMAAIAGCTYSFLISGNNPILDTTDTDGNYTKGNKLDGKFLGFNLIVRNDKVYEEVSNNLIGEDVAGSDIYTENNKVFIHYPNKFDIKNNSISLLGEYWKVLTLATCISGARQQKSTNYNHIVYPVNPETGKAESADGGVCLCNCNTKLKVVFSKNAQSVSLFAYDKSRSMFTLVARNVMPSLGLLYGAFYVHIFDSFSQVYEENDVISDISLSF